MVARIDAQRTMIPKRARSGRCNAGKSKILAVGGQARGQWLFGGGKELRFQESRAPAWEFLVFNDAKPFVEAGVNVIEDARTKAETYAKALNVRLGRVIAVTELNVGIVRCQ